MNLNSFIDAFESRWDFKNKTEFINEDIVKSVLPDGKNLLMYALSHCYSENFILKIINAGSCINLKSNKGRTPLIYALKHRNSESLICELLKRGADVTVRCVKGKTALMYALEIGYNYNIIYNLIDAGSSLDVKCNSGKNALVYAIENNYNIIEVIEELINKCGDINYEIDEGMTPFCYALRYRCKPEILKLMIDHGANVNVRNNYHNNMNIFMYYNCGIYCSVNSCCYKENIDLLLNNGVDIKMIDEAGCTVLHYVHCKYLISLAIKCGVSIDSACRKGYTPLMLARINVDVDKVKFLLSLNANPNCVDFFQKTPLHHFVKNFFRCDEIYNHLVYRGADMLAQDNCGNTPLHALSLLYKSQSEEYLKTQIIIYHSAFILNVLIFFNDLNIRDCLDIYKDSDLSPYSSSSYIRGFYLELNKMKMTYIKNGLTFYDFCTAKKLYSSKCIDISSNEYKLNLRQVSFMFPKYCKLILLRIKHNHRQNVRRLLLNSFENIFMSPIKLDNNSFHSHLPYDCLYLVGKYLTTNHLYNLFTASVEIKG